MRQGVWKWTAASEAGQVPGGTESGPPLRVCPESGPWITSPAETPVLGRLERPVVDSGYVADLQSLDAFVLLLELYHRNVGSVP